MLFACEWRDILQLALYFENIEMTFTHGSRSRAILLIRIVLALVFVAAAVAKLAGVSEMVGIFDAIGLGQWFRLLTGAVELLGAVLLLIPGMIFVGAMVLVCTMLGAIATHLFVIGGNALPAAVLCALSTTVAYTTRRRNMVFLGNQQ
ncbi:DoxX protein (modular protein) (plasmid) [Cupriavidus taiwanensis]|uniref:DoxX protein (Modular protein) n=1 Tax=Cupriavidus taiwanensis TaxID=164546 RepID=A0A375IS31_9BURK|nr:DoxX protein (modular protein) [Cupriavidus taiwanensis]